MASSPSAAYGVFADRVPLNEVIQGLRQAGVAKERICLMLSPAHPITTLMGESSARVFDREASAKTAGLIGWLSEFGAAVVPRFGFFVRSPEFFRSLVQESGSAALCNRGRTLASLGLTQEAAQHVDQACENGAFLYVACPQTAQTQRAVELLRASGADEVGRLENDPEVPVDARARLQ